MRAAAVLVAMALAGSTALPASEPEPLTKITVRAMAPEVLARRLFGELGRIMLPIVDHGSSNGRPTRPLYELDFRTIPTAAYSAGLCRSASVTVRFVPDGPLAGADTPVRPTGIDVTTTYIIADLARMRRGGSVDAAEGDTLAGNCAALDPRRAFSIAAPDEHMLVADVTLFASLVDAARAGPVALALNCPVPTGQPPMSEAQCRQILARLDPGQIEMVSRCDSMPTHAPGCFWLDVGGMSVRFESDSIMAPPSRVFVEPMIVIADERID